MSPNRKTEPRTDPAARHHDLIVIGVSCTEDIVAVPALPALDSHGEIEICDRWQNVGGHALNVAVHAANLGARSALISKVPLTIWAEVTAALAAFQVDTSLLIPRNDLPAPLVLFVTDPKGDDSVFVSDGTGLSFIPANVAHFECSSAGIVRINGFTLGSPGLDSQL